MNNNIDSIDIFPWSKDFETGIDLIDELLMLVIDARNTGAKFFSPFYK